MNTNATDPVIRVLEALSATPQPVDVIAERAGTTLAEAQASLALLEDRATSSVAGWKLIDPLPWANGHGSRLSIAEYEHRRDDLVHNEGDERFRFAPRALADMEAEYGIHRWDGAPGAVIESETNPWLRDEFGRDIDLSAVPATNPDGCDTCRWGILPGVLAPMDTIFGIQRCDECQIYPGDLAAARALADLLGPGVTVWFHGTL
ncbi:hypothetical protein [Microbacterium sp. NPDC096154]|uniref:DprA-like winged helix domain-containing protein n=1 Tax=Microbacterium sp. NPDC096154 TaxID=3155549 RepID=UPI00331C6FCC